MSRVFDLLDRARSAPDHVSALDAVMGEDWAVVAFDQPRRAQLIRMSLAAKHGENVSRKSVSSFGGGSGAIFPGYRPQAVVKMVRKGGASDVRGLTAQMAYLSRNGEQPLQRSERYMGAEIDAEEQAAIERSWHMPPEGSGKADRTSHFIVSFPQHAGHVAAEQAGRAWAEELFGSGNFGGDSYDYYTAFHTDREHPHMHVVVHRRGLDNGAWLKVSRRSDLNYDSMRAVLVEVAAREGIQLEATNRLERAVHDRPVPDAEYRRAREEGRAAVAPEHNEQSAILAAAALIHHARRFAADAKLIETEAPEHAALLRRASETIARGKALTEQSYDHSAVGQEARDMSERLEAKRAEVRGNFEKLDGAAAQLEPGAERVRYERQIAAMKAQSASMMAQQQRNTLRDYQERDTSGRYQGMSRAESGPQANAAQQRAEAQVRVVAERYGMNPDAMVERYSGGTPSRGLARQYAEGEARERERARASRGDREETPAQRTAELAKMHGAIAAIYREAREQATGRSQHEARSVQRNEAPNQEAQRQREQREASQRQAGQREEVGTATRAEEEARQKASAERSRQDTEESETERWIKERQRRGRDNGRGL